MPEIEQASGAAAMPVLKLAYGLDERGNLPIDSPGRGRFPGANLLRQERPIAEVVKQSGLPVGEVNRILTQAHQQLLAARQKRPRPLLDDKVLASWNGTMIAALARAAWVFDDPALMDRAVKAAQFILKRLRKEDGSLIHAFLDAPSSAPGYAEDYAQVIRGLLELYEATGEIQWLRTAAELQDKQIELFWDKEDGGFFDGPLQPLMFNRMKSVDEGSEFSPTAASAQNLVRLSHLLGRPDYLEKANAVISGYGSLAMAGPGGFLRLLMAYDSLQHPPVQVIVTGPLDAPDRAGILVALRRSLPVGRVILYLDGGEAQAWLAKGNPALAKLPATTGRTMVHLCRDFVSQQSFTSEDGMAAALQKAVTESIVVRP